MSRQGWISAAVSLLLVLALTACGPPADAVGTLEPDTPPVSAAAAPGVEPVISAGYKALIVHSAVFIAGRSLEDILRDELGNDPRAAASVRRR